MSTIQMCSQAARNCHRIAGAHFMNTNSDGVHFSAEGRRRILKDVHIPLMQSLIV